MVHGCSLWHLVLASSVRVLDGSVKREVRGVGPENAIHYIALHYITLETPKLQGNIRVGGKEGCEHPSPVSV